MSLPVPVDPKPPAGLTSDAYQKLLDRPMQMVPAELREGVAFLWTAVSGLYGMETPLKITTCLALWIGKRGLHVEDAAKVLGELIDPEHMAGFKSAGDVIAKLAKLCHAERLQRRVREEAANRPPPKPVKPMWAVWGWPSEEAYLADRKRKWAEQEDRRREEEASRAKARAFLAAYTADLRRGVAQPYIESAQAIIDQRAREAADQN